MLTHSEQNKISENLCSIVQENKVIKYYITICNGQHTYILKALYQQMEKKRNDYTIMYNEQQYGDENSEYKKERRKLHILQRKIIYDMKLL